MHFSIKEAPMKAQMCEGVAFVAWSLESWCFEAWIHTWNKIKAKKLENIEKDHLK